MKDGDNVIQGTSDLLNHATAFYKNLFGPATDSGIRLNSHIWFDDEKVSAEEKDILERVFSEEEIKNKIDHMENNKAARSDGIPAEFYK
jgi:protocatechuate 3,4-dioxygenase beta subunit